ncbi:MAG: cytosolic protein [Pseudomonadota bacterium]|nr:cytosolic protein [Pseudomonadota bacterium]
MKALMLITGSGPMVVLSSHDAPDDDVLLGKLKAKGIDKFMAYSLPLEEVKERYGGHFQTVVNDLHETDDLRVLDINGHRVFGLFRLDALGEAFVYEPEALTKKVFVD